MVSCYKLCLGTNTNTSTNTTNTNTTNTKLNATTTNSYTTNSVTNLILVPNPYGPLDYSSCGQHYTINAVHRLLGKKREDCVRQSLHVHSQCLLLIGYK